MKLHRFCYVLGSVLVVGLMTMGCDSGSKDNKSSSGGSTDEPSSTLKSGTAELMGFFEGKATEEENKNRKSFFKFSTGESANFGAMKEVNKNNPDDKAFVDKYDLFFDGTHGIACNAEIDGWEFGGGDAGIIDMGKQFFTSVKAVPDDKDFEPKLAIDDIKVGHVYIVRTADGEHFAKFNVTEFDKEKAILKFEWVYQTSESDEFTIGE